MPTDANAHGEYRAIRVDLDNHSGYKLAYRRGYYADAGTAPAQSPMPETAKSAAQYMRDAAQYLALPATAIPFYARVLPLAEGAPDVAGGQAQPRVELEKGRFVRLSVEYSTEVRNLSISAEADGRHTAHVEYGLMEYDPAGRLIHSELRVVRHAWTAAQFLEVERSGVRYRQQIRAPAKGAGKLLLLVHDLDADRLGSLAIPLPEVERGATEAAQTSAAEPSAGPR